MSEAPTWPGAVHRRMGNERPWHAYEVETEASAPLASVHVLDERVAAQIAACLRGEHAAEVERLRAQVAEQAERLARIAECLRQMADWDDYPPANDIFAMALVQVAGIARGDS